MPTMRDVAEKAGVSYTTVSFVLNRKNSPRGIGVATRERVLQAARDLNYSPNELARAMVTGSHRLLAFLSQVSPVSNEFKMRVQEGVLEEASAQGYVVKLLSYTDDSSLPNVIEQCVSWRAAGVVATRLSAAAVEMIRSRLEPHGIPVAAVELRRAESSRFFSARSDDRQGIRLALSHLIGLGHRKIAYLSAASDKTQGGGLSREEKFREVGHELGLPHATEPDIVFGDWWDVMVNKRAALELLQRPAASRPTAIVCCGDPPAMVVVNTTRSLGLRVPGDVSVVGFGDYTMALFSDPPLTTITQPFGEAGRRAAQWVISRSKRRSATALSCDDEPLEQEFPTRLTIRGSTGLAPPEDSSHPGFHPNPEEY